MRDRQNFQCGCKNFIVKGDLKILNDLEGCPVCGEILPDQTPIIERVENVLLNNLQSTIEDNLKGGK